MALAGTVWIDWPGQPERSHLALAPQAQPGRIWRQQRSDELLKNPMSYVMVDIESDGPNPGDYAMICFGAVLVEPSLKLWP